MRKRFDVIPFFSNPSAIVLFISCPSALCSYKKRRWKGLAHWDVWNAINTVCSRMEREVGPCLVFPKIRNLRL